MERIRMMSCCILLIALAAFILLAGLGSYRIEKLLYDPTPTPVMCAHQTVIMNGDDLSYFAVTEKACNP
jgi:hypothetical protein